MQPTDDALGLRLLGQVQELRVALERLNDRAEARALKARLLTLHDASRGITVAADVGKIVDEFFTTARDLIVKSYGTSAWEEPETVEEAKARMGTLPAAPGPGVLDRVNERETAPLADDVLAEVETAAREGLGGSVRALDQLHFDDLLRLVAEVRRLRSEIERLRAEAEVRVVTERFGFTADAAVGAVVGSAFQEQELDRLRSDEWLEKAAEEWARAHDAPSSAHFTAAELVAILRKHRDGKA